MKIMLGASGAGKSTILRLILGLLQARRAARICVNGQRVDELSEDELMAVRADLGMVFQEGALFDSLTVRENVGYRLFEETRQPLDEVDRAWRKCWASSGSRSSASGCRRSCPAASGGASRSRGRSDVAAADPALRRADDRSRSDHGADDRRRDHQAARSRRRELDHRDAPVARRVLHRDARGGARQAARSTFVPASPRRSAETEFLMLNDGARRVRGQRRRAARVDRSVSASVSFVAGRRESAHATHTFDRLVAS